MKAAKAEVPDTSLQLKVWCHRCSIRIGASEERVMVRDKAYHSHCHAKLTPAQNKAKA